MTVTPRASLRQHLVGKGNSTPALIAYLTLGDPIGAFVDCAKSILEAGAVTLELGVPLDNPIEGEVLLASHARARAGGMDELLALDLFSQVHNSNPEVPLIAVNQWHALGNSDALESFVTRVADAGASAILIVGLPFGLLLPFRTACDRSGVESVLSCFPDTPRRLRTMIYRQCTGCIYVARGRGESGGTNTVSVDELCTQMRTETDLPIIVGFGIDSAKAVAQACDAGANAAVVGSALVSSIAQDPHSAERFTRSLLKY